MVKLVRRTDWVNMLAGYVTLPALAFNIVMEAGVAPESWLDFAMAAMLATYLTFLVMFVVSVAVGKARFLIATMQGVAASFDHIGFLGIPLAHTLYGTEAALAVLVMLVSARMMHALLFPVLVLLARPAHRQG